MKALLAGLVMLLPQLGAASVGEAPGESNVRPEDPPHELEEQPDQAERERRDRDTADWMREQHDRAREWVREHPYR